VLQKAFDSMRDSEKPVYTQALADLKKAGVTLTPVDFDENLPAIRFLLEAEGAAAFDDITRNGEVRTLKGQTAGSWPNTFRSSRLVPAVEYIRAQRTRSLVIERFEKFMAGWDALVIPPQALLTTTNLTGNPQVVVKCGIVEDTLPDGSKIKFPRMIGFLGKIYDEGSPLRVALAYEQATVWHKMHPTLEG
jgi:Asp-tRNA(Asn)/Glu-tRNA(Gln) amidotransferase A subunit family amidase